MQFENATQAVSAAIRSIFQRWTALKLVVEYHMGGITEKADNLLDITISMATSPSKHHDEDDFINLFYDAFDRMKSDVQDGSPEQIASQIVHVRDAAAKGDFRPAMQLVSKANTRNNGSQLQSVDGGEAWVCDPHKHEPKRVQPSRQEAVVDEDGFTEVRQSGKHG